MLSPLFASPGWAVPWHSDACRHVLSPTPGLPPSGPRRSKSTPTPGGRLHMPPRYPTGTVGALVLLPMWRPRLRGGADARIQSPGCTPSPLTIAGHQSLFQGVSAPHPQRARGERVGPATSRESGRPPEQAVAGKRTGRPAGQRGPAARLPVEEFKWVWLSPSLQRTPVAWGLGAPAAALTTPTSLGHRLRVHRR